MSRRLAPFVGAAAIGTLLVFLFFQTSSYSINLTPSSISSFSDVVGGFAKHTPSNPPGTPSSSAEQPWHGVQQEEDTDDDNMGDTNDMKKVEEMEDPQIIPTFPSSNLSSTLVIASQAKDNTGWVEEELAEMISAGRLKPAVYVVDDPTAPYHPPINKGNEAMVYLSYIIDYYDSLADVTIFMHAHRWGMHNMELLGRDASSMIKRLSLDRVAREGFINLRCHWDGRCDSVARTTSPIPEPADYVNKSWPYIFPQVPIVPPNLATPCCGQVAVSREQIRKSPRNFYVRIREWLTETEYDNYVSGRVLEFTWQYVFTNQTVYCPETDECHCDTYGVCFGSQELTDEFFALLALRGEQEGALRKLRDERKKWIVEQEDKTGIDVDGDEEKVWSEADNKELFGLKTRLWEERQQAVVDYLRPELDRRLKEALERGDDPRERAKSAGREWEEGDGY